MKKSENETRMLLLILESQYEIEKSAMESLLMLGKSMGDMGVVSAMQSCIITSKMEEIERQMSVLKRELKEV